MEKILSVFNGGGAWVGARDLLRTVCAHVAALLSLTPQQQVGVSLVRKTPATPLPRSRPPTWGRRHHCRAGGPDVLAMASEQVTGARTKERERGGAPPVSE